MPQTNPHALFLRDRREKLVAETSAKGRTWARLTTLGTEPPASRAHLPYTISRAKFNLFVEYQEYMNSFKRIWAEEMASRCLAHWTTSGASDGEAGEAHLRKFEERLAKMPESGRTKHRADWQQIYLRAYGNACCEYNGMVHAFEDVENATKAGLRERFVSVVDIFGLAHCFRMDVTLRMRLWGRYQASYRTSRKDKTYWYYAGWGEGLAQTDRACLVTPFHRLMGERGVVGSEKAKAYWWQTFRDGHECASRAAAAELNRIIQQQAAIRRAERGARDRRSPIR